MDSSPRHSVLSLWVIQNAVVTMYTTCIFYVLPTRCIQASFMIQSVYSDHIPAQNLASELFNEGAVCLLCSRELYFKLMLPLNDISSIRYVKHKQVKRNTTHKKHSKFVINTIVWNIVILLSVYFSGVKNVVVRILWRFRVSWALQIPSETKNLLGYNVWWSRWPICRAFMLRTKVTNFIQWGTRLCRVKDLQRCPVSLVSHIINILWRLWY